MKFDINKYNSKFKFKLDFNKTFDFHINHEFTNINNNKVKSHLKVKEHHKQPGGLVHGGVYCSIAEAACSFGANATEKGNYVGISQNIDFVRSVKEGKITCIAVPIKTGRSIQIWEANMYINDTDLLCATSRVKLFNIDNWKLY